MRPRRAGKAGKVPFRVRWRRDRALILMTLPVIILLLLFNYVPLLGNVVAFQDYDPYAADNGVTAMFHSPWVGVEQFSRMMDDPLFWSAAKNTILLFVLQLVLFLPVPIALALLINSVIRPRVRAVAQAIMYLPHFFSWVLVVTVFQQIFGGAGIIAQTLENHGWSGFDLMTNADLFKYLVTAQAVWKDAGWGIIVFLAALAAGVRRAGRSRCRGRPARLGYGPPGCRPRHPGGPSPPANSPTQRVSRRRKGPRRANSERALGETSDAGVRTVLFSAFPARVDGRTGELVASLGRGDVPPPAPRAGVYFHAEPAVTPLGPRALVYVRLAPLHDGWRRSSPATSTSSLSSARVPLRAAGGTLSP